MNDGKKKVLSRKSKTHSTPWFETSKGFKVKLSTTTTTTITSEEVE